MPKTPAPHRARSAAREAAPKDSARPARPAPRAETPILSTFAHAPSAVPLPTDGDGRRRYWYRGLGPLEKREIALVIVRRDGTRATVRRAAVGAVLSEVLPWELYDEPDSSEFRRIASLMEQAPHRSR
jgi:hypothetical protein